MLFVRAAAVSTLLATFVVVSGVAGQTLNVSSGSWPPYFVDERGFTRDLLVDCLGRQGYEINFAPIGIEEAYAGLRSGLLDGHVFSYREDREVFLDYGEEPLFHDAYHPIVVAGSAIEIRSIEEFEPWRLGHLKGLRYSEEYLAYVQERRAAGRLVEVEENQELFDLLFRGEIDVFVNLTSTTTWLSRQLGFRERIVILPFAVKSSDYFFAVSKRTRRISDPATFLTRLDRCLIDKREDGSYQDLVEEYGLD